ncbi:MAG: site-specific integrase [Myxococcaceae bacterium]
MTKRRGNREGGLYQRADGVWCASLTIGGNSVGRRKRRVVYGKTKTEVQKKLLELQSSAANGTLTEPRRMKLAEYLKHWLEDIARPSIRASTYVRYDSLIRTHIIPLIGGAALTGLQPSILQNLYTNLEKKGASPRTREFVHAVMHKALKQALRLGYVQRNICDAVQKPRVPRKAMKCWSQEEANLFLSENSDDRFYALYVLALTTGLRQGELFGLKWEDVDFRGPSLAVRRTVIEISGILSTGEPKTAKGRRVVVLPEKVVIALKQHRERMLAEGHHTDWVFCDTKGGPLRKSNFRKNNFLRAVKRAKLPTIRFHDLRHTAATILLSQGVHPKVVQERLGHAQIAMTLDIYSHVLPSMQHEAAQKLNASFEIAI